MSRFKANDSSSLRYCRGIHLIRRASSLQLSKNGVSMRRSSVSRVDLRFLRWTQFMQWRASYFDRQTLATGVQARVSRQALTEELHSQGIPIAARSQGSPSRTRPSM